MKNLRIIFIISLTFISCDDVNNNLNNIVKDIEKHNLLEGQYTGIANQKSVQYDRFLALKKIATTGELVEIVKTNKNAVVRIYAYYILKEHDKNIFHDMKKILLKDNSKFLYLDGCVGTEYRINNFILKFNSI